jgi:hypothetical protein
MIYIKIRQTQLPKLFLSEDLKRIFITFDNLIDCQK